jgi:hypothetical protein
MKRQLPTGHVTPEEVLGALRLLQDCDGQPVLADHLNAQLFLDRRMGKVWRQRVGNWLRRFERGGIVRRVVEQKAVTACGTGHRALLQPAGWMVVA